MNSDPVHRAKELVWNHWQSLDDAPPDLLAGAARPYLHPDVIWNGPHPLNRVEGVEALLASVWRPLRRAFPDLRHETDILMGGRFEGATWVTGTGYLTGTFERSWLGIPATGRPAALRFGRFCRVEGARIAECYVIFDLLDLMRQAGFHLLRSDGGHEGRVPGPSIHDGLLLAPQDDAESARTLALVEAMLGGLRSYDQQALSSMGMEQYWDPEMLWFGPSGIGTTRGLQEFEAFHQRPFLVAFPDRRGGHHKARFGDGRYAASTGWPSLRATHAGPYLGHPATGNRVGMRVMDWWRRDGDRLVDNWVLIDMIDTFLQLGVDLMARLHEQAGQL